jgi:hypothetical protein
MKRHRISRTIRITLLLGAFGGIVGTPFGVVLAIVADGTFDGATLGLGAAFGAFGGAVLAPVAALALMRHVPLWRVIAETALGAIVGTTTGLFLFHPGHTIWLTPVILGLAGFFLAALRLRYSRDRTGASSGIGARAG